MDRTMGYVTLSPLHSDYTHASGTSSSFSLFLMPFAGVGFFFFTSFLIVLFYLPVSRGFYL
jgi:hypothetical protein